MIGDDGCYFLCACIGDRSVLFWLTFYFYLEGSLFELLGVNLDLAWVDTLGVMVW